MNKIVSCSINSFLGVILITYPQKICLNPFLQLEETKQDDTDIDGGRFFQSSDLVFVLNLL